MKIVGMKNNDIKIGELIALKEETLIVEMTQEEYQKCCAILYSKEVKENKLLKEWLEE